MFILYAVLVGVALGFLLGGRLAGLAELHFRFPWVILGALLLQVVLFSGPVSERIGELGPILYVGSTAAVVVAILADWRIPGLPVVALGAASNLLAILATGGYMPAAPAAMASLGKGVPTVCSNSSVVPDPALGPLTDVFAMPHWMPAANVFSVGDVIIGIGVVLVIVLAMRRPPAAVETGDPATSQ